MDNALSEVTQELNRWENQLNVVLNNAHGLYESKPLRFLANYQGITRQRAEEAKARTASLLDLALKIQAVVEQARAIHKSIVAFLPQGEKIAKIKTLLEGASITLDEIDSPGNSDLLAEKRAPRITPEALLHRMQTEFTIAKKSVDEMTRNISEKENLAATADSSLAGLPAGPRLEDVQRQVLAASQALLKDPLGSDDAAAAMKRLIQEVKGAQLRKEECAAELQALTESTKRKQEVLNSLKEQESKIHEELMAKVRGASTLSHAALVERLEVWSKTLLNSDQPSSIRLAGLHKWEAEAAALEENVRRQMETDSDKIQARDELKGRFLALKAKSADLRLSERPEICAAISDVAHALERPSDVDKASRSLVELSRLLLTTPK